MESLEGKAGRLFIIVVPQVFDKGEKQQIGDNKSSKCDCNCDAAGYGLNRMIVNLGCSAQCRPSIESSFKSRYSSCASKVRFQALLRCRRVI